MYSPLAIRLTTESDLCADGLSLRATGLTAAAAEDSEVLKERYSCIMYRGYLLGWLTERFLNAKLVSRPVWDLLVQKTTPKEQRRSMRKNVRAQASILNCNSQNLHRSKNKTGRDLLPSYSCSQAEMMLCADRAPDRLLYSGQLPFDDPWPLQASKQPHGSPEHIRGPEKRNI